MSLNTSPLTVGLTGGIGSGKSAVSQRFANLGITIVDADEIAREVVLPGQSALASIVARFGDKVIIPAGKLQQGELNRAELRSIIFTDPDAKHWLESLLHPLIKNITLSRLAQAESAYTILSSPLLLETQQDYLVNRILVVDTSEELQVLRTSSRDQSSADVIDAIIKSQISRHERLIRADDIIENSGSLTQLDNQVFKLHQFYLSLATPK